MGKSIHSSAASKNKMKKEESTGFLILKITLMFLLLVIVIWNVNDINAYTSKERSPKGAECSHSKFNIYSNSTEAYYLFGNCYIPIHRYYESKEKCWLFGISCYESSEIHTEVYTKQICFKLKTGKRC